MATDLEYAQEILKHLYSTDEMKKGAQSNLSYLGTSQNGEGYFLTKDGRRPLTLLLGSWWENSSLKHHATFEEYHSKISHLVLSKLFDSRKSDFQKDVLTTLKKEILDNISGNISDNTFYDGCHIIPYEASSFSIGPVEFSHINNFCFGANEENNLINEKADFIRLLQDNSVQWVASVSVSNVLAEKGTEISALSIDLALTSIQLLFSAEDVKGMRRFNALNEPHRAINLIKNQDRWTAGYSNKSPGISYSGPYFEQVITNNIQLMISCGNKISAFHDQHQDKLNASWCDAAYWFHEGIAEPLDTIAVAKLETSLEVLTGAESTHGSQTKILKILTIFTGKEADDLINSDSAVTVRQLANQLVRDRSRVLHGTLSTLRHDARENRAILTHVAQVMLREVSLRLDEYKATPSYFDDHDKFLDWLTALHYQKRIANVAKV